MVTIYILHLHDDSYYTGITGDLNRRMHEHRTGKSFSTRNKLPFTIVFTCELPDYKQAAKLERQIKNTGAFKWMLTNCIVQSITRVGMKREIIFAEKN